MIRWLLLIPLLVTLGCASQNRPAQLLGGAGPVYPGHAKEAGVEGYVTVVYDISNEGQVINLVVVESEPKGVFDESAIAAVSSWRFNPRVEAGQAVAVTSKQSTVTFKLSGADAYEQY